MGRSPWKVGEEGAIFVGANELDRLLEDLVLGMGSSFMEAGAIIPG